MYGLFRDSDREQEAEGGRRLEESEIFTTFSEVSLSVAHQRLRAKQRVVHRRRIKDRRKGKGRRCCWGTEFSQFLAAIAVCIRTI